MTREEERELARVTRIRVRVKDTMWNTLYTLENVATTTRYAAEGEEVVALRVLQERLLDIAREYSVDLKDYMFLRLGTKRRHPEMD